MRLRQPVSGLSHLLGLVLSALGLVWLTRVAASRSAWELASFVVFGATMSLVYTSSSLYHLLPVSERWLARLRRLDHAAIYVFIAGSYTPVCVVGVRGSAGLTMLAVVWALAVTGVAVKLVWFDGSRWLRIGLYLGMGWACLAILPALWRALPGPALAWLVGGGVAYTLGSLIYALRRPDPIPEVFGFHEIWHLWVMAGSFCHFWFVQGYLVGL